LTDWGDLGYISHRFGGKSKIKNQRANYSSKLKMRKLAYLSIKENQMVKKMICQRPKSRRQFLQDLAFGGVAFVVTGVLRGAESNTGQNVAWTEPIQTSPMPQPDATIIWSVAFSRLSGRMAVSAGPDEDQTSLYVNSPDAPENFQVYWSPDTEVHGVTSLAWSHNEDALAFIGMSGSRTTKTGEVWLYMLDVTSGEIRNILKIAESDHGEERRLVNVREDGAFLAWFGENKVCMPTRDQSIIAVDCNDGHIETLVPAQDCKIRSPVSVSPGKLRFLKMRQSGQGWELEVCEFDGSKITSYGIIPVTADKISPLSRISTDGAYAFICVKKKPERMSFVDKTIIFDISQWASVQEIPLSAKSNSKKYMYIPLTVLEGEQLVLLERIRQTGKDLLQIRIVTIKF
jgi:hypothetical protein